MKRELLKAIAPYAVGLALVGGWFASYTARQREIGALKFRLANTLAQETRLTKRADSLEKAYRVDTVTLRRTRTRTDSFFTHTRDTLIHRDTVIQIVEAERQACDAVVSACERRLAVKDSIAATLRERIRITEAGKPSKLRQAVTVIGAGLIGFGVGQVVPR